MQQNNSILLDGDAIIRVAKKLEEVLAGESIAVAMQAFAMVLMHKDSFQRNENAKDATFVRNMQQN